ncbi:Retrotransposon gag protein [Corchorus capsularis]|uniref:Retrotransposon gag protein n=1 Tax=Corchorus capsularis TaxID=210143 RepID=A0A1R3JIE3_COCAP|nr:Retrotransposon gag protein [Corchorus capsularis]
MVWRLNNQNSKFADICNAEVGPLSAAGARRRKSPPSSGNTTRRFYKQRRYEQLKANSKMKGHLKTTYVILQLADGSLVHPKGVLENILLKVEHLIFPIDIFVMDMEHSKDQCPLLLGRPFLRTSHTKIDVFNGSLTMEFDGEVIHPRISSQSPLKTNNFVCVVNSKWVKEASEESSSTKSDQISRGRQRILDIRQRYNENFHQFWERFKKLCVDCPHHGFMEGILIEIFYGGLGLKDRVLVDSSSVKPLHERTAENAYFALEELSQRKEEQKKEVKAPKEAIQGQNDRANRASMTRHNPAKPVPQQPACPVIARPSMPHAWIGEANATPARAPSQVTSS